jgi:hypothetical protein
MNIDNMTKEELESLRKKIETEKTLKINNSLEQEKEIVESLSEKGTEYKDKIQASRDERYEEMINESEEIPTIGSRRNF